MILCRAPQTWKCLKIAIVTYFQFVIAKPEMGQQKQFLDIPRLGHSRCPQPHCPLDNSAATVGSTRNTLLLFAVTSLPIPCKNLVFLLVFYSAYLEFSSQLFSHLLSPSPLVLDSIVPFSVFQIIERSCAYLLIPFCNSHHSTDALISQHGSDHHSKCLKCWEKLGCTCPRSTGSLVYCCAKSHYSTPKRI